MRLPPVRRKEREITDPQEMETIIRKARTCHIAMVDGDRPYMVTMCFGYEPGAIYLHSADGGRKIDVLKKNPTVCVAFEGEHSLIEGKTACGFGMHYESVLAFGRVRFIEDPDLKRKALDVLMNHYARGSFDYPEDTLDKTCLLRVDIEHMNGKRSG